MEEKNRESKKLLFLSTKNSARSQIAEGLLKAKAPEKWEVFSAGTTPTRLSPVAVQVMKEIGIDISQQRVTDVADVFRTPFNFVITVCDRAEEKCPIYPLASRLHWSISHPETLEESRQVRDELSRRIDLFLSGEFIHDGDRRRFHSDVHAPKQS
jgi:arsenate reductase (thioredoxin)